jgi:DNA-binding transcriptional MerR regulator
MTTHEPKWLTVGELAKRCGVTVRTLQYYDTHGLLRPTQHSEGGRRLYNRLDILRLQQILFLKALDFSLEEIRDQLLPSGTRDELTSVLEKQRKDLIKKAQQLQRTIQLIDQAIAEVSSGRDLETDHLFAIIGSIQQDNPYTFMVRQLDKDDLTFYLEQLGDEQQAAAINRQLKALTEELLQLHRAGTSPADQAGQDLAARWWALMLQITNGDPDRIQDLFARGADDQIWPEEAADLKEALTTLLGEALSFYFTNKGIRMPGNKEETP